jgi:hypothetical protein
MAIMTMAVADPRRGEDAAGVVAEVAARAGPLAPAPVPAAARAGAVRRSLRRS